MSASSVDTETSLRTSMHRLARLNVRVVKGPDAGLEHVFDEAIRIGSKVLAGFKLTDGKVSGLHCELAIARGGVTLRDLDSKNGTWVGTLRVKEAVLPPGTLFSIGDSQLSVEAVAPLTEVPLAEADSFHGLVGGSLSMRRLISQVERLSGSASTVLVQGESGTGKERVAEALHDGGPRADRPLVVVDCGALPANLIEAELFGHERGAFTGAVAARAGAFERAHGGTLFLDEVGELPLELQPRLLRALESRTVQRLGADRRTPVDVRVVAATHRDLQLEVSKGRFREDLYFRLAVVVLTVPPLRERLDDVPLLARHLLEELGADPHSVMTPAALQSALAYQWPGNVRELRNALERAVALMQPLSLSTSQPGSPVLERSVGAFREAKQAAIDAFERDYLTRVLEEAGGNVSEAARRAGLDRMSMHRALSRHALNPRKGQR